MIEVAGGIILAIVALYFFAMVLWTIAMAVRLTIDHLVFALPLIAGALITINWYLF